MISARTKKSNTSASDMESMVMHIVSYTASDGTQKEVELMASDPIEAIRCFRLSNPELK
jgi:hypothetical protein